ISYVSTKLKSPGQSGLKSVQATVPMQYNDGDQLIFKCFSGIYKTVIPLIPVQSQTVTSNFVACTDADDNNYATVTVGSQVWMAENLNAGTMIPGSSQQTNHSTVEKYCYDDDEANCNIYGGLYQWDEMMQYVVTPGIKGICPEGWHIPTDGEWCTVTQYLDPTIDCNDLGNSGTNAGGKMKSTGTIEAGAGLWHGPNTGATNESGFSGLPGGDRGDDGGFSYQGYYAYFWSSSQNDATNAWIRSLMYCYEVVHRNGINLKTYGFSVRCLRD
ncbi:MAG: hypothetical protein M0P58_10460, partial [Bacteroidales bacterium]|nr:hypothetical protein [Bacteroidales bacterium]